MLAVALVFPLTLASLVAALPQSEVRFLAKRDLEGFEACRASEFARLFPLDDFDRKSGSMLAPQELEDLQGRWNEAKQLAEERIAKIRADPAERWLYGLEEGLETHPFFGRVGFRRIDEFGPFYFYVQDPPKQDAHYAKGVADSYGRWFRELERVFVEEFATPLELSRREDYPAFAVFVLSTPGLYRDYAEAVSSPGLYISRAHYNPELRAAVTYKDYFGSLGEDKRDDRRAALHELVHELTHAYCVPDELPAASWLNEGLADYLSFHDAVMPGVLRTHPLDMESLLVLASLPENWLEVCLLPVEELVALQGYNQVHAHLERRAGVSGGLPPELTLPTFYAQSSLWVHYLRHGESGKHREAFGRYLAASLAGDSGLESFRKAFEGVGLAALDAGYRRYLNQHIGSDLRASHGVPAAATRIGAVEPVGTVAAAPAPAVRTFRPFEPAELLPETREPESAYAALLGKAVRGELGTARAELELLLARVEDEALRERLQREATRLDELLRERRRFLEHVARGSEKLDLRLEQRVLGRVLEVTDEDIRLSKNKAGVERLPLERIDCSQLARLMRDRKYGFEPSWILAYASLLGGAEDWNRLLDSGRPMEAALGRDAERDYPARLRLAAAVNELTTLGTSPIPAQPSAAEEAFAALAAFHESHADLPLVQRKSGAIARLGAEYLRHAYAAQGLGAALHVEPEPLAQERLRLTYRFERPEELEDFTQSQYLSSACHGQAPASLAIGAGVLFGAGCLSARHLLEFEGALTVQCKYRIREPSGSYDPGVLFLVGLHDDGLGSFLGCRQDGGLEVHDLARSLHDMRNAPARLLMGERYTLEARFDGAQTVESLLNGQPQIRLACDARRSGGVFLFASCGLVLEIDELVIEGTVAQSALDRLEANWIEQRLSGVGLVLR